MEHLQRYDVAVRYVVEFASDLAADAWEASGEINLITRLDDDWERVTVSDPVSPAAGQRFGRVRVAP